jgi:hypothetical protein
MSQRMDQEIRQLQRAGQRLETASEAWNAAYREYLGAMRALSRKTTPNSAPKHRSPKGSKRK